MKTLKLTDLLLQALFSLGAITALAFTQFYVFVFFLILIGATHIVSSLITVWANGRQYRHFGKHIRFLLSVLFYGLLGVIAFATGLFIVWLYLLLLISAWWYIWHTVMSIEEYQLWKNSDDQRNLLDLGN